MLHKLQQMRLQISRQHKGTTGPKDSSVFTFQCSSNLIYWPTVNPASNHTFVMVISLSLVQKVRVWGNILLLHVQKECTRVSRAKCLLIHFGMSRIQWECTVWAMVPQRVLRSCYKMSHGAGTAGHAQSPQTGVMKYQLFKASFSLQAGKWTLLLSLH